MTSELWQRVQALAGEALDLSPAERDAFLSRACAGDAELRRLVADLVESDEEAGSFLEAAIQAGAASAMEAVDAPALPAAIGRYRILGILGQGGMGSVFEAEQDQPRRRVALKVIRPGLLAPGLLRRFEREADALGRLHHAGIAEIYEAGTADGQPYFAMELVVGLDAVKHAAQRRLALDEKLQLMVRICRAVDHAHQRGVIHRDLKPGNILVDEAGQPKILDFGLARILGTEDQVTRQTDLGQLLGTLSYMSPEQLSGDPDAVDIRTDVYALGVILYELLAGRLPIDTRGKPVHAAALQLREEEPASLLTVSRDYRGDIDTIVSRAIEKEKSRRYESAAALADELERFLHHEPIQARPPSTIYQLSKFARRHRALVAGLAAVFLTLAAGVVASGWQALRAKRAEQAAIAQRDRAQVAERQAAEQRDQAQAAERHAAAERDLARAAEQRSEQARLLAVEERRRADTEAATTRAVSDFLRNDLLGQASAIAQANRNATPQRDLKVREALDRAAATIGGKFARQPAVEAQLRYTIGYTYHDLALYPEARTHLERAHELFRHHHGDAHPETLNALHGLAAVSRAQGHFAQAERIYAQAAEGRRRSLGAEHADTLRSLHGVAISLRSQSKNEEAIGVHEKVLAARLRVLGEEHPDTMRSMNDLAVALGYAGRHKPGLKLAERVVQLRTRVLGPEHPDTATSLHVYGLAQYNGGDAAQAALTFERTLALHEKIFGPDHPETINALGMLGNTFTKLKRYADASRTLQDALERSLRTANDRHPSTLIWMGNAGNALADEGKLEEACRLLRRTLAHTRAVRGPEHPDTQRHYNNLTRALLAAGKWAEAIETGQAGLAIRRRVRGPAHPLTLTTGLLVGEALSRADHNAEAEAHFRQEIAECQRAKVASLQEQEALASVLVRQGRYAEAEPLARAIPPSSSVRLVLGAALAGLGRHSEAESHLLAAYNEMESRRDKIAAPDRAILNEARGWIALLYERWGKAELAATYRR